MFSGGSRSTTEIVLCISSDALGQQAVGQVPWGRATVVLTTGQPVRPRLHRPPLSTVVTHCAARSAQQRLRRRTGAAPSNFQDHLPAADSDLAQQLVRDPYVFDFLDITERVAERELASARMRRLEQFLLELGHGFAFIGRQYHFEVGDQDFYIDLLYFN